MLLVPHRTLWRESRAVRKGLPPQPRPPASGRASIWQQWLLLASPLAVADHLSVPDRAHYDDLWQWQEGLEREKRERSGRKVSLTFL